MDPEDYEPDPSYCKSCLLPAKVRKVDEGIGPYEYWGAPGWHSDIRYLSECCDDENHDTGAPEAHKIYEKLEDLLKSETNNPLFLEYLEALWEAVA